MKHYFLFVSLILALIGTPSSGVHAQDICNDLLAGLSSEVKSSIHELAKLRYDLDVRLAQGLSDTVTRTLAIEFDRKWLGILDASRLSEDALSLMIRSEIQKIQSQDQVELGRKREKLKQESEELADAVSRVDPIEGLSLARANHTQDTLSDGRVVVVGGDQNFKKFFSVDVIDLKTKTIQTIDLIEPRNAHAHSLLSDDRLLVVGGRGPDLLSSIVLVHLKTGKVEKIGNLKNGRSAHTQSVLPDGRVLVAGGRDFKHDPMTSIEIIDPTTGKSEKIGDLHVARDHHSQIVLSDGRVLVAGGKSEDARYSIEIIDLNTRKIEKLENRFKQDRFAPALSLLPDGRVLATGGALGYWGVENEVIDPVQKTVEYYGQLKFARTQHAQIILPDGRLLLVGGVRLGLELVESVEVFDPKTKQSIVIGELNKGRYQHTLSVLPNGRVVVIGGIGESSSSLSLMEWIQVGRE